MNVNTLRHGNSHYATAIATALSALYHLDDAGATVECITLRSKRPVIRISPPAGHSWLHGAMRRRVTENGVTRTLFVTVCHGAQVEWETSHYREPEEMRA